MNNRLVSTLFILILIIFSCKKEDPKIPEEDQLNLHISGSHFDYYYSENDQDIIDTTWQEQYYSWLLNQLDIDSTPKLQYYKYRDNDHIGKVTGDYGNGFAVVGTNKFNTIWFVDSHECVHTVVTLMIGWPPALFNEGIAVAHQADYFKYPDFIPGWNGKDFHTLSKQHFNDNEIPTLDNLLGEYTFWDFKSDLTYPVAGSFTTFIIDTYGINMLKKYISISDFHDEKDKIRSDFKNTFQKSIDAVWLEWIDFLKTYDK